MSFDPDFWSLMPDTLRIEPWAGQDTYGAAVYGPPADFPCRVSGKAVSLRKSGGSDRTPIFDIWACTGDTFISNSDRVTILGNDPRWSQEGKILLFAVGQYTDDGGMHHTKLQCGFMYHRQGQ